MVPKPEQPLRHFIDVAAVLELLDVDRRTLDMLIDVEGLPCVKLSARIRRFDVAALNAWLDSRWSTRTPDEADAA
jgi:predicted DNA-binding transcriptional regulator AlpA